MAYETAATVGGQGEIHLTGMPFAPGTKVAVTVNPVGETGEGGSAPASCSQLSTRPETSIL
jgi:hypothetical protein